MKYLCLQCECDTKAVIKKKFKHGSFIVFHKRCKTILAGEIFELDKAKFNAYYDKHNLQD